MKKLLLTLFAMVIAVGAFANNHVLIEKIEMVYSPNNGEYLYYLYLENGDMLSIKGNCIYDQNGNFVIETKNYSGWIMGG